MQNTQTAKLQFLNDSQIDVIQTVGQGGNVLFSVNANGGMQGVVQLLAASGAVSPHIAANYVITKAGVAALTLAAPTATVDDGLELTVTSNTANAHTITATSLINNGTTGGPHTTATFAAFPGASITLMAYQAEWYVVAVNNVVIS